MDIPIIISVFVGILTYAFIQVVVKIFNDIIIPWYQSIVYQGIEIDGTWHGFFAKIENGEYVCIGDANSTIYLKQNGHKIIGERLLTRQRSGEEYKKSFTLNGFFYNNNLVIDSKPKEKHRMGGGSLVLSLTEDGTKLKGKYTYISSHDPTFIHTRNEVWVRTN